jgi:hydroxymethylpyrimidine pyrophosphatase-like HAD family hydrolase
MKIVEKIKTKNNLSGEVVEITTKKKFVRIEGANGIEWRRYKTNHEVKKEEFEYLEGLFKRSFPLRFRGQQNHETQNGKLKAKYSNAHSYESMSRQLRVRNMNAHFNLTAFEKKILEASENGLYKLKGVKFVKDETGWGLRESKDFFDEFFEKWSKSRKQN